MNKINLFKSIFIESSNKRLQEADKTRFLIKAIKAIKAAQNNNDINLTEDEAADILKSFQKFVNSGAADKYHLDWNKKPLDLYIDIYNAYKNYLSKGGSLRNQKVIQRSNPKLIFKKANLLIPNKDYIFVDELENDDYIFIIPLTHKACTFMNSFECGGYGAQWCIGTTNDDSWWFNHVIKDGDLFVMALNKKEYTNPSGQNNKLKFMIQLTIDYDDNYSKINELTTQAWKQTDRPEETLRTFEILAQFDHSIKDITQAVVSALLKINDCQYKESPAWSSWSKSYLDDNFYTDNTIQSIDKNTKIFNFSQILNKSLYKIGTEITENISSIIYNGQNKYLGLTNWGTVTVDTSCIFTRFICPALVNLQKLNFVEFTNIKSTNASFESINEYIDNISISERESEPISLNRAFFPRSIKITNCSFKNLSISKDFLDKYIYGNDVNFIIKDNDIQNLNFIGFNIPDESQISNLIKDIKKYNIDSLISNADHIQVKIGEYSKLIK